MMGASSVSKFVECIPEIIFPSCPDVSKQVYIWEPLPNQGQQGHGIVSSVPYKDDSGVSERRLEGLRPKARSLVERLSQ